MLNNLLEKAANWPWKQWKCWCRRCIWLSCQCLRWCPATDLFPSSRHQSFRKQTMYRKFG